MAESPVTFAAARPRARSIRPLPVCAALALTGALAACAPAPAARPSAPAPAPEVRIGLVALAPGPRFAAPGPVEGFADPGRRARLAAAFPRLDEHLARQLAAQKLPGLAFGVVIDGELAYTRALGVRDRDSRAPVDADTVFRIGSITKTFTALALLGLRDEGKLGLDDPVVRTLPELAAVQYATRDAPVMTLRHLLTHTSGLPPLGNFSYQSDHEVTEAEILSGLPHLVLSAPPGAREVYSNFGMALLGLSIERVAGARYRDHVTRALLQPLGMRSTFWDEADVPPEPLATPYAPGPGGLTRVRRWKLGRAEAAGGLYTSLRDLARYAQFQLAAYPPRSDDDPGPVRRSSVREAHAASRLVELSVGLRGDAQKGEPLVRATASGRGLAWHSDQTCELEHLVWHDGATDGYAASILLAPERGVGVVVLTNDRDADLEALAGGALEILERSGGMTPRTLPVSPALASAMQRVVELYQGFAPERYEALASPVLRDAVPAGPVGLEIARLRGLHGDCRDPAPVAIESASSGRFVVRCDRGRLEYAITLTPQGTLLTASLAPAEGDAARCPVP